MKKSEQTQKQVEVINCERLAYMYGENYKQIMQCALTDAIVNLAQTSIMPDKEVKDTIDRLHLIHNLFKNEENF